MSTNTHSEKGKQFIIKIEAYEDVVRRIHLKFPNTDTKSFKLREIIQNKDWLSYNFKGFPLIASYTKLVAMESDIKNKSEVIFNKVLSKK